LKFKNIISIAIKDSYPRTICNNVLIKKKHLALYNRRFYRLSLKEDSTIGQYYVVKSTEIEDPHIWEWKYYAIKLEEFENGNIGQRFSTWKPLVSIGTLIVPIKIRPPTKNKVTGESVNFDFTQDITIGTTFGLRYRVSPIKPHYINWLFGVGITSVIVDSLSTNGIVTESNSKISAFTPCFGVLFEVKDFQIGAFVGWDLAGRNINENWNYHGRTWLAVGLGYQILSRNDED